MSPTITLRGAMKFSVKKLLIGGEMSHSTFTGPGELLLAPCTLGDISILRLAGQDTWNVGKDAFLACTQGVTKEYKSQSFSKAMFSGEGLFVYRIGGVGLLWMSSFGAIIRKDVSGQTPRLPCCSLPISTPITAPSPLLAPGIKGRLPLLARTGEGGEALKSSPFLTCIPSSVAMAR